jgi:hypothetical protein
MCEDCRCEDCKKEPYPSTCWPGDQDFLDGAVELRVPLSTALTARWDADVRDVNGVPPNSIISVQDDFQVRVRVELTGDLWSCICGNWCFDFGFTAIGAGTNFNLSTLLPAGALDISDWEGCKTRCIEKTVTVPAGTIPGDRCGTLYEVGARFAFFCCEGTRPILVGYESKCQIEFY